MADREAIQFEDIDWDAVTEDIRSALHEIYGRRGLMLNKYVGAVEIMNADGQRWFVTLTPPEQKAWDTEGILRYYDKLMTAKTVREEASEE